MINLVSFGKDSNPARREFVSEDWASANPAHSGSEASSSHLKQKQSQFSERECSEDLKRYFYPKNEVTLENLNRVSVVSTVQRCTIV